MAINPTKRPLEQSSSGTSVPTTQSQAPLWRQLTTSTYAGGEDEVCYSIDSSGEAETDGVFQQPELGAFIPGLTKNPHNTRDPLEAKIEKSVNAVFEKRKLAVSRGIVSDYGVAQGDSFNIQCWGDKQCSVPATCCSTFVCRWLCCCCQSCVTEVASYEAVDKNLIRQECTTSYEDCVKELSVYAPTWFIELFLQQQNVCWNDATRFSMEDMFKLRKIFFYQEHEPWIGVAPVLGLINVMRMMTETHSELHDPHRIKPSWTRWDLVGPCRNAVETVSECKFLGTVMSDELIGKWLCVFPTGTEKFDAPKAIANIYNVLCANIYVNCSPKRGTELDPSIVMGLLLRIIEAEGKQFTPSKTLVNLAFDCSNYANIEDVSVEMQSRMLLAARKAFKGVHNNYWYENLDSTKPKAKKVVEVEEEEDTGCCIGCPPCKPSSCCQTRVTEGIELQAVVTEQPISTKTASLSRSVVSLGSPSPAGGRRLVRSDSRRAGLGGQGIGYGLMSTAGFPPEQSIAGDGNKKPLMSDSSEDEASK